MTPHERRIKKSHKKAKRDVNEPIKPANGYVLYLTRNRGRVREANPDLAFPDVTKILAEEWMKLDEAGKKPFMDEAAANKVKWAQDLEAYQKSDAYKQFQKALKEDEEEKPPMKKKKEAKTYVKSSSQSSKSSKSSSPMKPSSQFKSPHQPAPSKGLKPTSSKGAEFSTSKGAKMTKGGKPPVQPKIPVIAGRGIMDYVLDNSSPGNPEEIPIFTEQFLEHNKGRESELRKLRKITTEYEEQNAILAKHIENMKAAEIKLRAEMIQMREKNQDVIDHLEKLKVQFVHQFSNIPIPGTNEYPTLATVESYITRLHDKILEQQKVKGNKENELIQQKLHQFVTLMAED